MRGMNRRERCWATQAATAWRTFSHFVRIDENPQLLCGSQTSEKAQSVKMSWREQTPKKHHTAVLKWCLTPSEPVAHRFCLVAGGLVINHYLPIGKGPEQRIEQRRVVRKHIEANSCEMITNAVIPAVTFSLRGLINSGVDALITTRHYRHGAACRAQFICT